MKNKIPSLLALIITFIMASAFTLQANTNLAKQPALIAQTMMHKQKQPVHGQQHMMHDYNQSIHGQQQLNKKNIDDDQYHEMTDQMHIEDQMHQPVRCPMIKKQPLNQSYSSLDESDLKFDMSLQRKAALNPPGTQSQIKDKLSTKQHPRQCSMTKH
jgi:uncharacterized protein YxeA